MASDRLARRKAEWLALILLVLVACGGNGDASVKGGQVEALIERLRDNGLECQDLVVQTPQEDEGDGGSIVGTDPLHPRATEFGFCHFEDAPVVGGQPVSSSIYVFEDDEHLKFLPPPRESLGGQALVYGDTWEMYLLPPELGDDVRDALDGTLVMPLSGQGPAEDQ